MDQSKVSMIRNSDAKMPTKRFSSVPVTFVMATSRRWQGFALKIPWLLKSRAIWPF
jgi:hypothetical protein